MNAVRHAVRVETRPDTRDQRRAIESDVDHQHLSAVVEPVEVRLQKRQPPLDQPQAFPDAVTQNEARIEHGDGRAVTRLKRAIHRNEHRLISQIPDEVLRTTRLVVHQISELTVTPHEGRRKRHGGTIANPLRS